MRKIAIACFTMVLVLSLMAQTVPKKEAQQAMSPEGMKQFQAEREKLYQWGSFKFMMGTWKTEAAGFQVSESLDGKVLVLSSNEPNMAVTRARGGDYKSLTYIYLEGLTQRATTFDNQGGVYTYNVETGPQKLAFVASGAQRSRITFQESAGNLSIAVEGAPGAVRAASTIKAVRAR